MRQSKSTPSLLHGPSSEWEAYPAFHRKARKRSSLDTPVISDRTRLITSKLSSPHLSLLPLDLQITEALLIVESCLEQLHVPGVPSDKLKSYHCLSSSSIYQLLPQLDGLTQGSTDDRCEAPSLVQPGVSSDKLKTYQCPSSSSSISQLLPQLNELVQSNTRSQREASALLQLEIEIKEAFWVVESCSEPSRKPESLSLTIDKYHRTLSSTSMP